jgi:Putative DNA-binding domain
MKEPWEWDETDIEALIRNRVQEDLFLDYKRCDALQKTDGKKNEVSKDVSAFANSAGGIVVYGVEEDGHVPTKIDAGLDPEEISKEWLEQVINSRIQRRIDGVVINQIQLSGARHGKVLYVVVIPSSQRAPHMASDNRFYKRFNFESVPMQEYEVRDVSRRMESSDLDISIEIAKSRYIRNFLPWNGSLSLAFEIHAYVGNSSDVPAENCFFVWYWDRRLTIEPQRKKRHQVSLVTLPNEIRFGAYVVPVYSASIHWRPIERPLIWSGIRQFLTSIPIRLINPSGPFHFFWEAQAPYMEKKKGGFILNLNEQRLSASRLDADWRRTSRNV